MEEVICNFCSHKQKSKSKLKRITCSSCGKKILIENIPINTSTPEIVSSSPEENNSAQIETNIGEIKKEDKKKLILD